MKTRFHSVWVVGFLALACLGTGGCSRDVTDKNVVLLSPGEAYKRLNERSMVMDLRGEAEFEAGRVPRARLTRLVDIDDRDETPRFGGHPLILVYSQNPGQGSGMAMAKKLIRTKHKNVRLLDGGFDAWVRAGLPVERSEKPTE
jgi:rhodanese-related sulfurtransferase